MRDDLVFRSCCPRGVDRDLRGFSYGPTVDAVYTEAVPRDPYQRLLTPNSLRITGFSVIEGMIQAISLALYCVRLTIRSSFRSGPIADAQFDPNNRVGFPAALMGLQALSRDENLSMRIFEILNKCGRPKNRRHQ